MALHADQQVAGARESFLGSLAAANDQQHTIRLDGENDGVGGGHDGWRVDDHKFEFGAQVRRWHPPNGAKTASRPDWEAAGRWESPRDSESSGCGTRNEIQARNTRQIGTQTGVLAARQIQQAADARLAQVRIDEHSLVAELGECDGQVCGGGGLAFTGERAGHENYLRRTVGLRKQQRSTQCAKSLGHLRFGQMLSDEFAPLLVTVG